MTVNSASVTHLFDYNALGETVRDRFFWTNPTPSDGIADQWVTTSTTYDSGGREISSTDANGNTTITDYNALGQVDWTQDEYGNKTFNYYGVNGQLVETVSPTGTESITAYDSLNRAYLTMDEFNPANGATADGSMTIFNSQGQSIETENLTGVDISVSLDSNNIATETVVSTGTVMSSTSTTYNPDGTVASSTSATGLVTTYQYYLNGQQESTTQVGVPTWNGTANVATNLLTGSTYDMLGRTYSSTDAKGNSTIYSYLSAGLITTTTFADQSSITTTNDIYGNKISQTDQNGNITYYSYNVAGELIEVDQPAVPNAAVSGSPMTTPKTFYTYDVYGNELTQTDASGNITTFTYNALGQETSRQLPDGTVKGDITHFGMQKGTQLYIK